MYENNGQNPGDNGQTNVIHLVRARSHVVLVAKAAAALEGALKARPQFRVCSATP